MHASEVCQARVYTRMAADTSMMAVRPGNLAGRRSRSVDCAATIAVAMPARMPARITRKPLTQPAVAVVWVSQR